MSLDEPEEEYWDASRVKTSKKRVNIFDDNVTVEAASDLAKYQKSLSNNNDDDDIETTDWADEAESSFQGSSRQTVPTPASVGSMNKMGMIKSPSTPDPKGNRLDSEPDLYTGVTEQKCESRKPLIGQDQEIQFLKQQLQQAKGAIGTCKLTVKDTIKRMISGQPYSLEQYRSKAEKLSLLDKAIATHDGNAIIAALLFLKGTLKEQLFNVELLRRPAAVDQYLAYLKAHYNLTTYAHMLERLSRTEELAMFKYKQAVTVDDPASKIQRVQGCLQAHFKTTPGLEHECGLIQQQISLLQRQRPVDVGDEMLQNEGKHTVFRQVPRATSIINMPVITTLYYCCVYHYDEGQNLLSSPASIRTEHQLTDKQYVWTAVKARARLRKWSDIDALFISKGFFGTKMKCVIGFDKVVGILHKAEAPPEVLSYYLKLVDDVDRRLELARKMQCHDAIVETYRTQRDRQSLQTYYKTLKPNSREWFLTQGVLNDQTVKWKT